MIKLGYSESLKRKIRQDKPFGELAIPTWDLIARAIKEKKTEEALDLLEYARGETRRDNDGLVSFTEIVLSYLPKFGEQEVFKVITERSLPKIKEFLSVTHGVEETLIRLTEAQRGHHAEFVVTEEPDRYVVRYDPCGSGGRLKRLRPVGVTSKPYPWSWGKAGVPYYCCHCCIQWEIIGIELQGSPIRITLPGDRPEDPCTHLYYKKPEFIPEEYYTRVGKKKGAKSESVPLGPKK